MQGYPNIWRRSTARLRSGIRDSKSETILAGGGVMCSCGISATRQECAHQYLIVNSTCRDDERGTLRLDA